MSMLRITIPTGISVGLFMLMLLGCDGGQQQTAHATEANVLAYVNDTPITRTQVDVLAASQDQDRDDASTRMRFLNELVSLKIIAQAAEKDGLTQQSVVAAQLEYARDRALVQAYLEQAMATMEIGDEELKTLYRRQFSDPTEYKARHILLENENDAKSAIVKLQAGADFAELAKAESTGPSAAKGGDLGWFAADKMVPAFGAAVRAMTPGRFSETPVKTRFGWHVILLEETRESTPPPFAEVADDLRSIVANQRLQDRILKLRQAADVKINTPASAPTTSDAATE